MIYSIRYITFASDINTKYNMNMIGVITGDIIDSTKMDIESRNNLLISIEEVTKELKVLSPLKLELFRGDSFQMIVYKPEETLKIAVLLRAKIKSITPHEYKKTWDARLAVGIGEISYTSDKVIISDGEAFHFSGRELDEIGKRRLTIKTKWKDVNDELKVSTAFADNIITDWTVIQAQIVYQALLYKTPQKDIAIKYKKTAQNISKILGSAKENLINIYLERYYALITNNLTK